jgi:hypothetical protein
MHDSQDDGNDNCKDDFKDKIFTRLEKNEISRFSSIELRI